MKEASWKECVEKNLAKKVSPDIGRANSLIKTLGERIIN